MGKRGKKSKQLSKVPDDPVMLSAITNELIAELVADLDTIDSILVRHNLTRKQFKKMSKTATFKHLLDEQSRFYHAPGNAAERIAHKAAFAVEDTLGEMHKLIVAGSNEVAPSVRLDAHKAMSKLAGVGEKKPEAEGKDKRVSIIINLGDEVKTISALPTPVYDNEEP